MEFSSFVAIVTPELNAVKFVSCIPSSHSTQPDILVSSGKSKAEGKESKRGSRGEETDEGMNGMVFLLPTSFRHRGQARDECQLDCGPDK